MGTAKKVLDVTLGLLGLEGIVIDPKEKQQMNSRAAAKTAER